MNVTALNQSIISCEKCPRLREHCRAIALTKRRAWNDWEYWGQPVPSFGDPAGRLLIVGLAPGAHGANRTGRMFTGDRSGEFLYRSLHLAGFASQPESKSLNDGLILRDAWITAAAHCAPPDNKPTTAELNNCRPWLEREFQVVPRRVVVALGKIAFDACLSILGQRPSRFRFAHNVLHNLDPPLISSYHPSQQNTSTGRLTQEMLDQVFLRAAGILAA